MASRRKFLCPICGSRARSIETRINLDGSRRRRLACTRIGCLHRWTPPNEPATEPAPQQQPLARRSRREATEPLSDEDILQMLLRTDLSNVRMGRLIGRNKETVRQVRLGIAHASRLPHIERWGDSRSRQRTCEQCDQWLGYCTLGHPDPEEEGLGFASECLDFLVRQPVKVRRPDSDSPPAGSADSGTPAAA